MELRKIQKKASLLLLLFWIIILQTSCANDTFNINGFEVIGSSVIQNSVSYDFTSTLITLYPQSDAIVLAEITAVSDQSCEFIVKNSLVGNLQNNETYSGEFQDKSPLIQNSYLLFLDSELDNHHQILFDGVGWLRINGDKIFPSNNNGATNLVEAERTIKRLDGDILLPSRFYYYRELEELALESDTIFIGKLLQSEEVVENYFTRYNGVETSSINSSSILYTFRVEQIVKGNPEKSTTILLAETMLQNTSRASNDKLVTYTLFDAPALDQDALYLVFTKDASKLESFDAFFINPIQGYLPILQDENGSYTMSVPTNSAFVEEENLDDVINDILLYLSGENISTQYEPFSVE